MYNAEMKYIKGHKAANGLDIDWELRVYPKGFYKTVRFLCISCVRDKYGKDKYTFRFSTKDINTPERKIWAFEDEMSVITMELFDLILTLNDKIDGMIEALKKEFKECDYMYEETKKQYELETIQEVIDILEMVRDDRETKI